MGISFSDATSSLLAGEKLSWDKYKDHKAGSITLGQPAQRRLFEFLLSSNSSDVAAGSESLFDGIIQAWNNDAYDPATSNKSIGTEVGSKSWRLDRIEAMGFGGLTLFNGKTFDLSVGGFNWCLEGQNGSGKTSLASAILWALTGKRIREHEGPIDERGERQPVENDSGKIIGKWPPLVAYPDSVDDLGKDAEAWVRLTFKEKDGETATAFRRILSPANGEAQIKIEVDDRLRAAARLVEIGVLMPARIAQIGFGKNSHSLFEAVKQLTGLDQLSDIAEGCSALGAGNRKFLKYAKDQGIDTYASRFEDSIASAKKLADEFQFSLPEAISIDAEDIAVSLKQVAEAASKSAGDHLGVLTSEIPNTIDVATPGGRNTIKNAVSTARGIVSQGSKGILLFQTWKALGEAPSDEAFANLPRTLETAKTDLTKGLEWHRRQTADKNLRIKALAAQNFIFEENKDSDCPLCTSPLDNEEKRKLANELNDLKSSAAAAERKIADVCRNIRELMAASIPIGIRNSRGTLDTMNPVAAYSSAMMEKFVEDQPFSDVLIGLAEATKATLSNQIKVLPSFSFVEFFPENGEPEPTTSLRREIHSIERLIAMVEWWATNRSAFVDSWYQLIGKKKEDETFPAESLEGRLAVLEQALAHARPLDDLSKYLLTAAAAASDWQKINVTQKIRDSIAKALAPLKDLKLLVAAETASSIAGLSGTIRALCGRISLQERLAYEEAVIAKKEVSVTGSFTPGMRIDAALVANTSWLRAILWSFVFALREQTLQAFEFNPMPLVVLDDPQATFDPRNKRKWAEELVRSANLPNDDKLGSQLILTTHERSFYQMVIDREKFNAQQGLIARVNKTSGAATVTNGGNLQRAYDDAKAGNDDAKAREYIRKVRIYCEDLIKFMLRGINKDVPNMALGKLRDELKNLHASHVAPFDRSPFKALIDALNESLKPIKYINEPHHSDDETYGVAEADNLKEYWDTNLVEKIHTAFSVFDTFDLYTGEPRTFPWAKNVISFPDGHKDKIKSNKMLQTGIAAAAKTDGRAGDGILTIQEWENAKPLVLPNHGIFQLAAGTLDPVAGIGDLIIVSNYMKPGPRDLVTAISGTALLARRYNLPENHPEIVVLTGQAVDPLSIAPPMIVPPNTKFQKIVGTLFTSHLLPAPPINPEAEVVHLSNPTIIDDLLNGARLFKVQGRSAEPIALDGQYLLARPTAVQAGAIPSLDGRPIIAIDENGARYFKRLRCKGKIAVLESLNPDGTTPAEILALDDSHEVPQIKQALEVVGVLFELPNS